MYPLCNVCKFVVNICVDLLKRLRSYGSSKLRGRVSSKFLVPPSGKTIHQTPKVLELQEHARGRPLLPCQV